MVLLCFFIVPAAAFSDTLLRADKALSAEELLLLPAATTVECSLSILEDEYAAHNEQVTADDDGSLGLKYAVCTATDGTTYDIEDSDQVEEEAASGERYTLTLHPSRDMHGHHLFKVAAAVKAGGAAKDGFVSAAAASNAVLATSSSSARLTFGIIGLVARQRVPS